MVLIFQVDIAKTLTNMKCAPEQVVWVGARENAEMESSEEKLALHLHFIHCPHLQNKCPELQGVNVAGTSMGEKECKRLQEEDTWMTVTSQQMTP